VCINPNDPKNAWLKGKRVIVPIANREVPIIEDEYVDIEFGTGCLKVTPAHDVNDYMLGEKYSLEAIDIFNDDGTLNKYGLHYEGKDRFTVREEIEKELIDSGLMEKVEPYQNKVGFSERTNAPIEPKLSMQWFLKMEELAKPALEAVEDDTIRFHPSKFKNMYRHWMSNIKDWCISRQLWWGHQIPAWYMPQGGFVVAETREEAYQKALSAVNYPLSADDLRQDDDVLDTWFSSWLWPISVFDGINHPDNKDINYYYPTNDLVTAPEIIFFWVARMIISGFEYRKLPCFYNVYFTGIVRDKLGRKMSKSLGNSPDPIELMNKYGADGVRMGMLLSSPAGNDLRFDEALCEQGRNFNNKIWNALRLLKGWEIADIPQPETARKAIEWFDARLTAAIAETDDNMDKYRISEALMNVYNLFWDEFSSWYLEIVKPAYRQPLDRLTYLSTINFFERLMLLLHPFMPFITEEVWHLLDERSEGESIMTTQTQIDEPKSADAQILSDFEVVKQIIAGIRTIRLEKNIPNSAPLALNIVSGEHNDACNSVIIKLCNLSEIRSEASSTPSEGTQSEATFMVGAVEYSVPVGNQIDIEEEIEKLEKELKYQEGFLESVMRKLGNEKFVANAKPEIVAVERKKQADAESKIAALRQNLANLKK